MQQMSGRLSVDVMHIQTAVQAAVLEDTLTEEFDFNALLLMDAATRRSPHIVPEDELTVDLLDIAEIAQDYATVYEKLPTIPTQNPDKFVDTTIWVVGDFDEKDGYDLLQGVAETQQAVDGVSVVLLNNPELVSERPALSTLLHQLNKKGVIRSGEMLLELLREAPPTRSHVEFPEIGLLTQLDGYQDIKSQSWYFNEHAEAGNFWKSCQDILKKAGFKPGQRGLIVNGRVRRFIFITIMARILMHSYLGCGPYTCKG